MGEARCEFYDGAALYRCERQVDWVTYQSPQATGRPARHYCDAHWPPWAKRAPRVRQCTSPSSGELFRWRVDSFTHELAPPVPEAQSEAGEAPTKY